jgi:hypothetical protein
MKTKDENLTCVGLEEVNRDTLKPYCGPSHGGPEHIFGFGTRDFPNETFCSPAGIFIIAFGISRLSLSAVFGTNLSANTCNTDLFAHSEEIISRLVADRPWVQGSLPIMPAVPTQS